MSQKFANDYSAAYKTSDLCNSSECISRGRIGNQINSHMRTVNSYNDNPNEGCNAICGQAGGLYRIKVFGNDSRLGSMDGKCLGYLTLYHRARRNRGTPWSMAIIPEKMMRLNNELEKQCPFSFWKIRRAHRDLIQGNDNLNIPQETPFDFINHGMVLENINSTINRSGTSQNGNLGAVNSAWCANNNQCSNIYTPTIFSENRVKNPGGLVETPRGRGDYNLRFFMTRFTGPPNPLITDDAFPLKIQPTISVKSDRFGDNDRKRELYAYVLHIYWTQEYYQQEDRDQKSNASPYLEVVFDASRDGMTPPGNKRDNCYKISFEFEPVFDDGGVNFVYAGATDKLNADICMAECCNSQRNILRDPENWDPSIDTVCVPYMANVATDPQIRNRYYENICRVTYTEPKSIFNLEKPECVSYFLHTNNANFNAVYSNLTAYCATVDRTSPLLTEDEVERINSLCACYNDQQFYDNLRAQMREDIAGTPAVDIFDEIMLKDSSKYYCWFKDCAESPLSPVNSDNSGFANCTPNVFLTCIQYIDVTFRDGKWEFDEKSGLNNCILNNDQGSLPPDTDPIVDVPDDTPPGTRPPGTSPGSRPPISGSDGKKGGKNGKEDKGKGTNLLIYGGIGFIILIVIIIIVVSATRSE